MRLAADPEFHQALEDVRRDRLADARERFEALLARADDLATRELLDALVLLTNGIAWLRAR